jgi:RNA polymerase sigma-70 factor (ECF subfamily)
VSLKTPSGTAPANPAARADDELVLRCQAGDPAAWRSLYDRHFPAIERLVLAVGVGEGDADDLCQEIFLIVYRHLRGFRAQSQLATWIHRIGVREAIRFARRGRLRQQLARLFQRERPPELPADWSENAASRRHYLRELLARLRPERRLALVLFEIEGLAVADIARLCACAEATVWTRLHRARADLEKLAEKSRP